MKGQVSGCMGDMLQPNKVALAVYVSGILLSSENIGFCSSKMHKKSNSY